MSRDVEEFFIGLVIRLPYIVLWVILILVVTLVIRKIVKKNKAKKQERKQPEMTSSEIMGQEEPGKDA